MSKPVPGAYRTTNWRDYNAALKQRGSLLIWFDPEMEWVAAPSGRRGRPATFSDAAIQTCLMLKALFGLPLRQTTGLVASLLRLAKLDWPVPDFSIRPGQVGMGCHSRSAPTSVFAISMSLRMRTVRASFPGLPAARSLVYLALRSGFTRMATSAGM